MFTLYFPLDLIPIFIIVPERTELCVPSSLCVEQHYPIMHRHTVSDCSDTVTREWVSVCASDNSDSVIGQIVQV